eukprot:scaffold14102_cov128-Isochrysis_galbana.AAC.3
MVAATAANAYWKKKEIQTYPTLPRLGSQSLRPARAKFDGPVPMKPLAEWPLTPSSASYANP